MSGWLALVLNLPGPKGTVRVRTWRALKAAGAASLRDGVSLVPDRPELRAVLEEQRRAVRAAGGSGYLFAIPQIDAGEEAAFRALFDRTADFEELGAAARRVALEVATLPESQARRSIMQLRRDLEALAQTDYFGGAAQTRARQALAEADAAFNRIFSPGEPAAIHWPLAALDLAAYRRRTWATRRRLWIDRIASAWLIKRFIDPEARFVWLADPSDCPLDAIGFDFDGAEFTHVDHLVTFEVLIESFGLRSDAALMRIAEIVHALDTGSPSADAPGIEAILAGIRAAAADDDALLAEASRVLDHLYASFASATSKIGEISGKVDRP